PFLCCPGGGNRLVDKDGIALRECALARKRSRCEHVLVRTSEGRKRVYHRAAGCGSPLWPMTGRPWRGRAALYIKRHLRRFFDYLVLDEVHQEAGAATAQANAAGSLAAACKQVIALTGTLLNGYAESLRPFLFRLAPGSLVREGLGWSDTTA